MKTAEEYFESIHHFKEPMLRIRAILLSSPLDETIKWNIPTYTLDNKNVVSLSAFSKHFGLWFFNGVYLSDPQKLLRNVQEGKTQAMRQLLFFSPEEVDEDIVHIYINEAVENQRNGKTHKVKRKNLHPDDFMCSFLQEDKNLYQAFQELTQGQRNEFIEYINEAKRESTKLRRMEKIIPMIHKKEGLYDKYR